MSGNTKGHQKIKLEKISKKNNLQVTFSKRKNGLFKKASELSTLCGAETAIILHSPGEKVFSFGSPTVQTVINRYVSGNAPPTSGPSQLMDAERNARIDQLNMQLNKITDELNMEKKRGEELDQIIKASQTHCWWEAPIEELNLSQLEVLKVTLEDLKSKVAMQAQQLLIPNPNPSESTTLGSSNPPPQFTSESSNPPQWFTPGSLNPPQWLTPGSSNPPPSFTPGSSNPPQLFTTGSSNTPQLFIPGSSKPSPWLTPRSSNPPQSFIPGSSNSPLWFAPESSNPPQSFILGSSNLPPWFALGSANPPQSFTLGSSNPPQSFTLGSSNPPQCSTPDSFGGVPNFEPQNSESDTNMVSDGQDNNEHPLP